MIKSGVSTCKIEGLNAIRAWRDRDWSVYPPDTQTSPVLLFDVSAVFLAQEKAMIGSTASANGFPRLTLVVGGARSGKSLLAENLVLSTGRKRNYIATAEALDDEMRARVDEHLKARGPDWQTWNVPLDVDQTLALVPAGEIILFDCATLWLSNHMMAGSDIMAKSDDLLSSLAVCASPVVIVSNEVGMGIVPENAMARAFRDHQGRLNQQLAGQADLVVGVMAGLPIVLKGTLPAA